MNQITIQKIIEKNFLLKFHIVNPFKISEINKKIKVLKKIILDSKANRNYLISNFKILVLITFYKNLN